MMPFEATHLLNLMKKAADDVESKNFPVDLKKELQTRAIELISVLYKKDRGLFSDNDRD